MKWFFMGEADYASSAYLYATSLVSKGHEIYGRVRKLSPFKYPYHFPVCQNWCEMRDRLDSADAVWIIQSDIPRPWGGRYPPSGECPGNRAPVLEALKNKFVVIQHGGSYYRKHRQKLAKMWRPYVDLSICHEADLMGSFENEHSKTE